MKDAALRFRLVAALCFIATMSFGPRAAAPIAADKPGDLSSVLAELRQGGLVVYFRHGRTDRTGATDEEADLTKCETQRNLSAEGREQASQAGKAFRALGIPFDTVLSSAFCRCKDTARLVLGEYRVDADLNSSGGIDAIESKREAEALRRMLATPPARATNTVIFGHSSNLRDATGLWLKEGAAYVFRPAAGGKADALALIPAQDWAKSARQESSGKAR